MNFATPLNWVWVVAPLIVLTLSAVILLRGLWHFAFGRLHWGAAHVASGLPLMLLAAIVGLIVLNTQTFARLAYEAPVAEVEVAAITPGAYRVTVRRLDGANATTSCTIMGDEWELSARVQKWKAWANLIGLNTTYALDQIANKYFTAARGNGKTITACDLGAPAPEVDRLVPRGLLDWLIAHSYAEQRNFGSAVYMPLADGAIYRVIMTQAGLNAAAVNPIARAAAAERI